MKYKLLYLTAALLTVAATPEASAQKKPTARKPVAKTASKPTLPTSFSIYHLINIYKTQDVPTLDEYLTSRKWRFANSQAGSQSGEDFDQVVYNNTFNGVGSAKINVFLCNVKDGKFCIRPELHEGTSQHIFEVVYTVNKSLFDKLQADIKERMTATGSKLEDGTITTVYRNKNLRFVTSIERKDDLSKYTITFGDVSPGTKDNSVEEPVEEVETE